MSPSGWRIRNQVQPHSRFYGPDNNEASTHRKRKRSRDSFYQERYAESDNTAVLFQKTQQLVIGGDIEVELFYSAAFKNMQQMCCKVMAKAFVKLIEPKKQAHYPYTRGDAHAPPWWPDTAGENSVRHKEPDHLLKPGGQDCSVIQSLKSNAAIERIRLLVHILRVVTMPREKQCVSIQKLGLNARKLEEATMESVSHWFNENQHPENATKQVILEEIFKVAHVEERYRNGEIGKMGRLRTAYPMSLLGLVDGTTCVPVLCSHTNKVDNPDAGEPNELVEGEAVPIPVTIPTSQNLVLPTITMQSRPQQNADPGDFYRPHITAASACHYSQSRLEEYDLYGDSSNPTHEFYPQSPGQHDPYHWPILSSPYQRPSNLYMVGRTT